MIEVDAANGLANSVEVWYRSLNRSMKLKVEYAWQPPLCTHCCVFGHNNEKCIHRVATETEKMSKDGPNVHVNTNSNDVKKGDEVWKTVPERKITMSYNEPVVPSKHVNNVLNGRNTRSAMSMGRGGPSIRGSGGLNGRVGMNSYQGNNDKKSSILKSNDKNKEVVVEGEQKQVKNKGGVTVKSIK